MRHTLDDEEEQLNAGIVPTIDIQWQSRQSKVKYVVVCPHTLQVLTLPLQGQKIGSIDVKYPEFDDTNNNDNQDNDQDNDEYDEDEQLYSAMTKSHLQKKYPQESIPIVLYNNDVLVLTFPNFSNIITFNVISEKLIEQVDAEYWLCLAPSNLNNNQTINKLYVDNDINISLLNQIPNLKPPHIVTGISAAIVSQLNYNNYKNFAMIVLNSEGHPGFEKSDSDAIVDTAYILSNLFIKQKEYLTEISKRIRKFNPYSNSGMYL